MSRPGSDGVDHGLREPRDGSLLEPVQRVARLRISLALRSEPGKRRAQRRALRRRRRRCRYRHRCRYRRGRLRCRARRPGTPVLRSEVPVSFAALGRIVAQRWYSSCVIEDRVTGRVDRRQRSNREAVRRTRGRRLLVQRVDPGPGNQASLDRVACSLLHVLASPQLNAREPTRELVFPRIGCLPRGAPARAGLT